MTVTFGDGTTIEDWTGQAYVNNVGMGRPEIAKALADQSLRMSWVSPSDFAETRLALSEDLRSVLPRHLTTPFYGIGGSDTIEAAVRAARKVTGRKNVLTFKQGYHGDTFVTEDLSGIGMTPYGDPRPWSIHVPSPYDTWQTTDDWDLAYEAALDGVKKALKRRGPRSFACVVLEPVMGVGGAVPMAGALAEGLQELRDRYGFKLIADEVVTGFGRTGRWFGSQTVRLAPDAVVLAKGLTGGYAPLGATVFERSWGARLRKEGFNHGLTFGGHPVGCAAARETIRILKAEGLVERSAAVGTHLRRRFEELQEAHAEIVRDVYGAGLLLAMELRSPRKRTKEDRFHPASPRVQKVTEGLRAHGIAVLTNFDGSSIVVCPPFIVTEARVDRLADRLSNLLPTL